MHVCEINPKLTSHHQSFKSRLWSSCLWVKVWFKLTQTQRIKRPWRQQPAWGDPCFWLSHNKNQWQYIHVMMRPSVMSACVWAEVSWGQAWVFPCLRCNVTWSVDFTCLHIQKKRFNYSVLPQWHSLSHEPTLTHKTADSHSYYDDKMCRRHSVSECLTPLWSSTDGCDSRLLCWYDIMYSWKLCFQIDSLFHWKLWITLFLFLNATSTSFWADSEFTVNIALLPEELMEQHCLRSCWICWKSPFAIWFPEFYV